MKAIKLAIALTFFGAVSHANDLPTLSNSHFQSCLNTLKNSATFRGMAGTLENYRPTAPDPTVIRSLNYQPEFKKDVWDYLAGLVDTERVIDGINAKRQHQQTLTQIQSRYGVDFHHVLGVWGVESNFGQTMGKKNLFDSLATLSCFDRRQSYFRKEYANALRIVQNGDIRPSDMTGSWAGAFGQTQFMPSTFLELAVDFDGDGRKDLVNSVPDALASTANFLARKGYRTGEPWGYEVNLNGYAGASGRTAKRSIAHWRNMGLTLPDGRPLPSTLANAGLLLPAGRQGPAFLVGKNFDTFYSYNQSESYALAIAHLSDLIKQEQSTKTDFITPWPTDDAGISRQQAKEIQQALIAHGYNIGAVDGIIGDGTRAAIMEYQRKMGVVVDGRAGQKFYRLISTSRPTTQPATPVSNDWGAVRQPVTTTTYPNPVSSSSINTSTGATTTTREGVVLYQKTIKDGKEVLVPVYQVK